MSLHIVLFPYAVTNIAWNCALILQSLSSDYCVYNGVFVFEWPKVKDINKIDSSESVGQKIFLGIGID